MAETSFDFLNRQNPVFRKKIDGCFVGFAELLDKYLKHVSETPKQSRKPADVFLSDDLLLEMMINDFGCHDEAIQAMEEYAKIAA
jgi:hypothetical protein